MPTTLAHPVDVIVLAQQLSERDNYGAVFTKPRLLAMITAKSALVQAKLKSEFPNLNTEDFWYIPHPVLGDSNVANTTEENKAMLIGITLKEDLGMDGIEIVCTTDGKITIYRDSVATAIVAETTWGTAIDNTYIAIPADSYSTVEPKEGDRFYTGGYTCSPLISHIVAGMVVDDFFRAQIARNRVDVDPILLSSLRKDIFSGKDSILEQLQRGDMDIAGRNIVSIGQYLSTPAWVVDSLGYDVTDYSTDRAGNEQMYP